MAQVIHRAEVRPVQDGVRRKIEEECRRDSVRSQLPIGNGTAEREGIAAWVAKLWGTTPTRSRAWAAGVGAMQPRADDQRMNLGQEAAVAGDLVTAYEAASPGDRAHLRGRSHAIIRAA